MISDIKTTQVVYVGSAKTEVPGLGEWEPGVVKGVNDELLEWLLQNEAFKVWVEAPKDGKPDAVPAKATNPGTEK